jgi:hypothetical protein
MPLPLEDELGPFDGERDVARALAALAVTDYGFDPAGACARAMRLYADYGAKKHGQPLMCHDGRGPEDEWQERFSAAAYRLKRELEKAERDPWFFLDPGIPALKRLCADHPSITAEQWAGPQPPPSRVAAENAALRALLADCRDELADAAGRGWESSALAGRIRAALEPDTLGPDASRPAEPA